MKKSKYSESQIISILKEAEAGMPVAELCRKHDMSDTTFYDLRAKYSVMGVSMMKWKKELEDENRRMKAKLVQEALEIKC